MRDICVFRAAARADGQHPPARHEEANDGTGPGLAISDSHADQNGSELDEIHKILHTISRTPKLANTVLADLIGEYMFRNVNEEVTSAQFLDFLLQTREHMPVFDEAYEPNRTLTVHSLEETKARASDGNPRWHKDAGIFFTGQKSIVWVGYSAKPDALDAYLKQHAGVQVSEDPPAPLGSTSEEGGGQPLEEGMQHSHPDPQKSANLAPFKMHLVNISHPF